MGPLTTAKAIAFVLTRDRALTLPFYADVLGLRLLAEDDFAAVFDLNGSQLRLTTEADHVAGPHPVLGWQVPDLVATSQALQANGVEFTIYPGFGQDVLGIWTSPDGATKVNWFSDPEGNVLSMTEG